MKIGLLSDSHGNIEYIKKAGYYLKENAKVDLIVHLGDEYGDADVLGDLGIEILKVPGLYSNYYHDPSTPNHIVREIEGVRILITHYPDVNQNDLSSVDAVFYGHTHIPKIENKDGVVWINPGHSQAIDKKGAPASFAVAEIKDGKITAQIVKYSDII